MNTPSPMILCLALTLLACGPDTDTDTDTDGEEWFDVDCYSAAADWVLTPDSIEEVATGDTQTTSNPIQQVLGKDQWSGGSQAPMARPGDVIELMPGDYEHFRVDWSYDLADGVDKVSAPEDHVFGRDPQTVLRAATPDTVRILHNPVGGSDTFALKNAGALTLCGLSLEGDDRASVLSSNPDNAGRYHQGFRDLWFIDTPIDGGYDFDTDSGTKNKWGVLTYAMSQSTHEFGWVWKGGQSSAIQNIYKEHAFYMHNVQGNILLEGNSAADPLRIKRLGRTAFQMANRVSEGPDGTGDMSFHWVRVEDACLEQGGGGSVFSFKGNHTGQILLDEVTVLLGADPTLPTPFNDNITGALVAHAGGGSQDRPNGDLIIRRSHFQVGPYFVGRGSARRANVKLGKANSVTIEDTTIVQMPTADGDLPSTALEIDTDTIVLKPIVLKNNTVVGDVIIDGVKFADPEYSGAGYAAFIDAHRDDPHFLFVPE